MKKTLLIIALLLFILVGCKTTKETLKTTKKDDLTTTITETVKTTVTDTISRKTTEPVTETTITETVTTTIGKHTHEWNDGVITKPQSCKERGIMTYTCEICSLERNVELDLLPHDYDDGTITENPTCEKEGTKTFTCKVCENIKTETINKIAHNYVLSTDGLTYKCETCNLESKSGKDEIGYTGDKEGEIMENEVKNYLFIGSSITNGYDAKATIYYSMADMFKEDYLIAEYKIFDGKKLSSYSDVYLRKIDENESNTNKVCGTYRWYETTITLNDDFTGTLSGEPIKYEINGEYVILHSPTGKVYNFKAKFNKGDNVYKYAENGYTLSGLTEKYTSTGTKINPNSSYVYLMNKALNEIGDKRIDTVIIQLSTNDIGQYIAPNSTTHIPFGEISTSKKSSNELDYNTSFGALEWLIAKAREKWNANVIVYTCHMSTSEYQTYKSNGYDLSKVNTTYKEMYDACLKICETYETGLVNLFANKDVNIAIHEDATNCLADTLHLKKMGYEKVLWPVFRKYVRDGE